MNLERENIYKSPDPNTRYRLSRYYTDKGITLLLLFLKKQQ